MVFSNLSTHEKDAFFALLDEYFSSRPDLLANLGSSSSEGGAGGAAASAVHRALAANPETTSRLVSAGLRQGVPKDSPYGAAAHNDELNSSLGRVAAASLAFSAHRPSAPPRRVSSAGTPPPPPADAKAPSIADRPDAPKARRFGDVDTSSARGFYDSLRGATANKSATSPPPHVPGALGAKRGEFAPPPVRRVAPAPSPRPQEEAPAEEEPAGEWAEALYEYTSSDPGDLELQAKQRVVVVEKTSDDWWTGELDGRRGLFPASYVKLL